MRNRTPTIGDPGRTARHRRRRRPGLTPKHLHGHRPTQRADRRTEHQVEEPRRRHEPTSRMAPRHRIPRRIAFGTIRSVDGDEGRADDEGQRG
jgi:hypothetical protein